MYTSSFKTLVRVFVEEDKNKKGNRRMPWHRKAMKDVIGCDKPGVGAKYPATPGSLNGETRQK